MKRSALPFVCGASGRVRLCGRRRGPGRGSPPSSRPRLVREDLAVGHARCIIHGHVCVLPADAAARPLASAVSAMADAAGLPELLQVPRPRPFRADDGPRGRERRRLREAESPPFAHHRRDRHARVGRDATRVPALPPLVDGLPRDPELARRVRHVRAGPIRPLAQFPSRNDGQSCIVVDVHRSSGRCRLSLSTTPAWHCYGLRTTS